MEILLADVRSDIGMITTYGNPSASIVLIQMVDDHDLEGMESEAAEIKKLTRISIDYEVIREEAEE